MNEDCIFCKIVKGEIATKKVRFSDEFVLAFDSIEPVADTHILIVPKMHIASFLDLNDRFNFSKMIEATQSIVTQNKIESGYKLIFNGGKYQTIPHLHWHLLAGDLEEI